MRKEVREWFLENQRVFPWRQERTPYRVLVSEMMLQQTRASVVIAYFERWMARFPTIDALAKGEEGEVIKLWEGLGYYSRARNLLRIAKMGIPDTYEGLLALPGVGAYTAGAVWAFGFGKKAVAMDGNVRRVMSRFFAYDGKELATKIAQLDLDPVAMEGLIELGATLCGKRPLCAGCPLQQECLARQLGQEEAFPLMKKRPAMTTLHRLVFCGEVEGGYVVRQGKSGLYEFPYKECEPRAGGVVHHFTRYKIYLHPQQVAGDLAEGVVKTLRELQQLPFSAGHKKILELIVAGSLW